MRALLAPALLTSFALLAGCGEMDSTPTPLTEKQAMRLEKEIKGKVAGEPINCLNDRSGANLIPISDDTVLYRSGRNLVYLNKLNGSCSGLANDSNIMVTESFGGSSLCRGDLVRMVDRISGIPGGTCSLGDFIPYRKPAKGV